MKRILFIGRFQPFHNGHMYVLKKLLKQYREVVIVVGSAEAAQSWRNPLTSGERVEMILGALTKEQKLRTILIPVRDINNHAFWVSHVSSYVPCYEAVYSNNVIVNRLFRKAKVKVLTGYYKRQIYEGQKIRSMIVNDDSKWEKLVPKEVVKYLKNKKLDKKLNQFLSEKANQRGAPL